MNKKPTLTCWGGVGTVTGANFLLETENKKSLIDCGLLQGVKGSRDINESKFEYDISSIDQVFITHAHIDHIGRVPKLFKDGFKGVVYSTPETRSIAELMLQDTAKISENNARSYGGEPIYTARDVKEAMSKWQEIKYHEPKDFGDFSVELYDAGHILGSSMYKFSFKNGTMLFTGDLGNSPSPLLRDTEEVKGLDYLLMDSVYGDRNHESIEERERKFKEIIKRTYDTKGTLLIPTFSLERTQDLLYKLNNLFEDKVLPVVPVFLDSPLAIRVTEVYDRVVNEYNKGVQDEIRGGDEIFRFPKLRSIAEARDSRELIHVPGPKIIMAGSGMSTAGRIVDHEENFLPDPNTTLLLVGYQAIGTLGRELEEGAKNVVIKGTPVKVRARIEKIDGFSAHKGSDDLVEFASKSAETLKKVFVTMGEPKSSMFLAERLHDELGLNAIVPKRGEKYELDL
jgi:metallo-beta-lactamase family protein